MAMSVTSREHVCETCGLFVAQPRHIQNVSSRKRADDPILTPSCCLLWGPWRTSHSRPGWDELGFLVQQLDRGEFNGNGTMFATSNLSPSNSGRE